MHSGVVCSFCIVLFLVAKLGSWVEMGYVYTLFVRKAGNFWHRIAVVLYVICKLIVWVILLVIFAFCIWVVVTIVLHRGLAHSFFCCLQSETYIHKAVCGRQSKEANLKAVLEKQNLGETVSVLKKNKFYDSKSLRTLNDSHIDTLVRCDELPSSTGESFDGGVRGLEVTPFGCREFVLHEFDGGNVIARKALEVLQVQADARSGHVRGVRLQKVLAPVPRDRVGGRGTI
jgi:hypothetical protein